MKALCDRALAGIRQGTDIPEAMDALMDDLGQVRASHSSREWREECIPGLRAHAVYPVLLEDPFVRHSAVRPRGYPGDAELLDFIYRSENIRPRVAAASGLGRDLYAYTSRTSVTQAVRNRLEIAAGEIDRLAESGSRPRVMSVACGHLREAGKLNSLRTGRLGKFVAADQDPLSLEVVRHDCLHFGVEAVQVSAKQLIRANSCRFGGLDFIYALGLYDYLSDGTGARLLSAFVDLLKPGGRAWIANFVPELVPSAYMEAVMDWWLIYRTPNHLASLADRLDQSKIGARRIFQEPENNVAILELVRI